MSAKEDYEKQPDFVKEVFRDHRSWVKRLGGHRDLLGAVPTIRHTKDALYAEIPVEDFGYFVFDKRVQRLRRPSQVAKIRQALRSGGIVINPIVIASRKWGPVAERKLYWVVDGQQRVWAHHEEGKPIVAIFIDTESLEQEREMFRALNIQDGLGTVDTIRNHNGLSTDLLHAVESDPSHPLNGKFNFNRGSSGPSSTYKWSPRTLIMVLGAVSGVHPRGNTSDLLRIVDYYLHNGHRRFGSKILHLLPHVFPEGTTPLAAVAFASVCHDKWVAGIEGPCRQSVSLLARTNWRKKYPNRSQFAPVVKEEMEKRWR